MRRAFGWWVAAVALVAGCGDPAQPGPGADLASTRDAAGLVDLAVRDQAQGADLRPSADLRTTDGAAADLSPGTDGPVPDLAALPDLAMPDLSVPDLAMPDLAVPDLAPPPDLRVSPDLVRLPDLVTPPDQIGLDFAQPDLAQIVDLAEPDLAMPVGMVTASLSAVALGQDCRMPVGPDPVTFTANLKITNVGNVDVGPVTAMSGEITQFQNPIATFTIVPTFTNVIKPGASETIQVTKLDNSVMPANACMTLNCNGGYNVAISYMGPSVPLGNRAVSGLTFVNCIF